MQELASGMRNFCLSSLEMLIPALTAIPIMGVPDLQWMPLFILHTHLHLVFLKPWSQIPLRTSYERFLTIYVMVKKSFVRRSQGYLWPRLYGELFHYSRVWKWPKSETNFWKECIKAKKTRHLCHQNHTHTIVHSSAMYYQTLNVIHEPY